MPTDPAAPPAPASDNPAPGHAAGTGLSAAETEGLSPEDIKALEEARAREAALRKLMDRISGKADFPSLRDSIRTIQTIARSETAHLRTLGNHVSGDVAVTSKMLRIINAAFYRSAGGGTITSLPKAIAIMGLQPFSMLLCSLLLFERIPKGPGHERIQTQFSRSLMAGLLANELCHQRQHFEQAYLVGLFMKLGEMLVAMHFPDEFKAIEDAVELALEEAGDPPGGARAHELLQREAKQLLGLTFEELGAEIASQWGWPAPVVQALRRKDPDDPEQAAASDDYLRVLCTAATDLAQELHQLPDTGTPDERAEARAACLGRFGQRLGPVLALDPATLPATGEHVVAAWSELTAVIGVKALQGEAAAAKASGRRSGKPGEPPAPPSKAEMAKTEKSLVMAVNQVRALLEQGCPRDELFSHAMEALLKALDLDRVVLALLNPREGELLGSLGRGRDVESLVKLFRIRLGNPEDLFSLLCTNGKDALISDSKEAAVAKRIPLWHLSHYRARTFLVLPLQAAGRVVGALYGDREHAGSLHVSEQGLHTLQDLRSLMIKAMSQPPKKPA